MIKTMVTFRSRKFPPYDGEEDEFLCFTDPSTPIVRKLFKKVDLTEELERIVNALEAILSADPDIMDVAWSTG